MVDRRLSASIARSSRLGCVEGREGLEALLAAMGSTRAAPSLPSSLPPPHAPLTSGVGESVWDPAVLLPSLPPPSSTGASRPSAGAELLRARSLRRLQAAVESSLLSVLGESVVRNLDIKSRLTIRKGNGLMDRWLAERRLSTPPEGQADPLLPLPYDRGGEVGQLRAELIKAGASEERAEAAAVAMGRAAEEALRGLRRGSIEAAAVRLVQEEHAFVVSLGGAEGELRGEMGGGGKGLCAPLPSTLARIESCHHLSLLPPRGIAASLSSPSSHHHSDLRLITLSSSDHLRSAFHCQSPPLNTPHHFPPAPTSSRQLAHFTT